MIFCDWYSGTVYGVADPDYLASKILDFEGVDRLVKGQGGYNRPRSLRADVAGGMVAIFFGNDLDIHVVGTSGAAPLVMTLLRAEYPLHGVARCDVAWDFDSPGSFEKMWRALHELATGREGRKVQTATVGDWIDAQRSRTLYLGKRGRRLMVRVYEKGKELSEKYPDQTFSSDLTRCEFEVRPETAERRRWAATATLEELAAFTPFGRAALKVVSGLDLNPVLPVRSVSTMPLYWMLKAYRNALLDLLKAEPSITVAELVTRDFAGR